MNLATLRSALVFVLGAIALPATSTHAPAQALPAGIGPGTYIQAGATFSTYQIQYGERCLSGASAFVDAHIYRRWGAEAEYRTLLVNQDEGVHESTFLVGPRFSVLAHHLRPYAKFMVGRAEFTYPFHYAKGSYLVIAPGGGVDWHIPRTKVALRLIDVEMQDWPNFSFGTLRPYGVSTGISFQVFDPEGSIRKYRGR